MVSFGNFSFRPWLDEGSGRWHLRWLQETVGQHVCGRQGPGWSTSWWRRSAQTCTGHNSYHILYNSRRLLSNGAALVYNISFNSWHQEPTNGKKKGFPCIIPPAVRFNTHRALYPDSEWVIMEGYNFFEEVGGGRWGWYEVFTCPLLLYVTWHFWKESHNYIKLHRNNNKSLDIVIKLLQPTAMFL